MSTKGRYNLEFKKTIVRYYEQGKSVAELSKEFQLKDKTIYAWINEYSIVKHQNKTNDTISLAEYKKLEKELREAKLDVEILKKSISIFSKK